IAPRISKTHRPDFLSCIGSPSKWISRGNRVWISTVDVDPEKLAEECVLILSIVIGISAASAVAQAEVEHSVRAEHRKPAVVVRSWMRDSQQQLRRGDIRLIRIR